jgi:hypothetical protein
MAPARKSHAAGSESGHTAPRPKRQTASRRKSHAASRRKGYAALRRKGLTAPDSETACARPAAPAEWRPGWPCRPIARCQITTSRIANGLLTASETSIIHSLARELPERDQCLNLNGGLSVAIWARGHLARPARGRAAGGRDMPRSLQVQGLDTGVPPVGVEPTLGTLLGGRPLPLGYGGWAMIPRSAPIIRDRAMG